jgi:hypothetical protein
VGVTDMDLINWTLQEAQQLKIEQRKPNDLEDASLLDKLLAVLQPEPAEPTNLKAAVEQFANTPGIQTTFEQPVPRPSREFVTAPKTDDASDLPLPTGAWTVGRDPTEEPESALLMAIVAPDIYTARVDRDRAIALRWVLRDIQNKRLKWWPINQHDLRVLIDVGLVEMRDDAPELTNAGVTAII